MNGDANLVNPGSDSAARGAVPPPLSAAPPVLATPTPPGAAFQTGLATLLSLFLAVFLVDAVVSLADDAVMVFGKVHLLGLVRAFTSFLALVMAVVVYGLIGGCPMIPKRVFLPLVLFGPLVFLAGFPILMLPMEWLPPIALGVSLLQVTLGIAMLHHLRGGSAWSWPLVPVQRLVGRGFSGKRLLAFAALNLFVVLPALAVYCVGGAVVAVRHFSDGFVALRADGIAVQARHYVRDDGKIVRLMPMVHIADRSFYHRLSQSFTTNAVILMEGVTDQQGLLTNKISYQRVAESLGVAQQQTEFNPVHGELVPADVDVAEFSTNTVAFLNVLMRFQSRGLNPDTLRFLRQYRPPAGLERDLIADLVQRRNRHLGDTLRARLPEADHIVIPWGAAHMPGIARDLATLGFRVSETQEYMALRFGGADRRRSRDEAGPSR
jgi:hypothetical protein